MSEERERVADNLRELCRKAMANTAEAREEADRYRVERDEARRACGDIVASIALLLPASITEKLWERCIRSWPWMAAERSRVEGEGG